jgi:ferrous-iron efflux pump FieF
VANRGLNISAGLASVATAAILAALKLWALAQTGSLSVAASLADSAVDLLVSTVGLVGIVYAAKPADDDHSFGHTSVEDLVALGQALLVAATAFLIAWNAAGRLADPVQLRRETVGLGVMGISVAITLALVAWQTHVARRTGSRIVAADRMHYAADLLPALGAMAALVASDRWGVPWLDPVVALAACAALLAGAARIGVRSWDALMDRRADPALIARVSKIVDAHPGVRGHHDLRTRMAGTRMFVQVHIELDGDQTLREAHSIGAALRRKLIAELPDADVIVHKDPV